MLTNDDILLSATVRRDDIEEPLQQPVSFTAALRDIHITCQHGYSMPPASDTFSLSDIVDGTATLCGSSVYRHGIMTCGHCNFAMQEVCPYSVADTVTVGGVECSVTDADFLPLCPVRKYGLVAAYTPDTGAPDNYYVTTRATGQYSTPPTTMYNGSDAPDSHNGIVGTFDN